MQYTGIWNSQEFNDSEKKKFYYIDNQELKLYFRARLDSDFALSAINFIVI